MGARNLEHFNKSGNDIDGSVEKEDGQQNNNIYYASTAVIFNTE